jgi:hypothetical protein
MAMATAIWYQAQGTYQTKPFLFYGPYKYNNNTKLGIIILMTFTWMLCPCKTPVVFFEENATAKSHLPLGKRRLRPLAQRKQFGVRA